MTCVLFGMQIIGLYIYFGQFYEIQHEPLIQRQKPQRKQIKILGITLPNEKQKSVNCPCWSLFDVDMKYFQKLPGSNSRCFLFLFFKV